MSYPKQTRVLTSTLWGYDARPVEVRLLVQEGPLQVNILGLPQAAVRESRERIRAALHSSGFELPYQSVVITLAPADLLKEAYFFDLPITLALLASCGHLPQEVLDGRLCCGGLGLDGSVRWVRGGLAMAELGRRLGIRELLLPTANAPEAAILATFPVVGLGSLVEAVLYLKGAEPLAPVSAPPSPGMLLTPPPDLSEVRGQETAKRALEVAAAGGHNLLFVGPPGAGKTMLARRLPSLLPPLTQAEAVAITKIHSLVAEEPIAGLLQERPFRSPHSGTSTAGMIGGGANPRPGEVSLAHHGVLFLDELPEFRRETLEALRQPLEQGVASVVRSRADIAFPARFSLFAAMNP